MRPLSPEPLARPRVTPEMVLSCGPAVYRPGLDGWRTIDTLVVGPDGVKVASRFQTDHPLETRTLPC